VSFDVENIYWNLYVSREIFVSVIFVDEIYMMSMYDVRTMFTCPLLCRSISEDKLIVGGWVGGGVRVCLSVCLSVCACVHACVHGVTVLALFLRCSIQFWNCVVFFYYRSLTLNVLYLFSNHPVDKIIQLWYILFYMVNVAEK
jgi:hypothetical protein